MRYLKTFEGFEGSSVQEKITDFFKSREGIADALLVALKEDPEKALNAMISYYEDFLDHYYSVSGGEIARDKTGKCTLNSENLQTILKFVPRFAGNMNEPGIFIREEDGDYVVDRSKLKLAEKITRNEIMNLLSPHEDFSLNKLNIFAMYRDKNMLRRLDDTDVPYEDVDKIEPMDNEWRVMSEFPHAETREQEAARKAAQANR